MKTPAGFSLHLHHRTPRALHAHASADPKSLTLARKGRRKLSKTESALLALLRAALRPDPSSPKG